MQLLSQGKVPSPNPFPIGIGVDKECGSRLDHYLTSVASLVPEMISAANVSILMGSRFRELPWL